MTSVLSLLLSYVQVLATLSTNKFYLLYFPQFTDIGIVTGLEANHKPLESARKGMEVCIKIEPTPGDTPKLYGRHFDHTDLLVSKVNDNELLMNEKIEATVSSALKGLVRLFTPSFDTQLLWNDHELFCFSASVPA